MFRVLTLGALLFGCTFVAAGELTVQALADRIEALEQKNRELEKKLRDAEMKPALNAQVDKAVEKCEAQLAQVVTDPDPHARALKIGGYLDFSYQYNFNRPDNRNNNNRVFDRDSNGFNLHLAEVYFSRLPEKPGQAGFRVDMAFGTDARFIAAQDNIALPAERNTDFEVVDLKQAYMSYIVPVGNGLTLDAGKFVTCCGSEVIEAADDINASRSLLFGYAIPFTHTGVRATYPVFTDKWTVQAWLVNGWDNVQDQNDSKAFILSSSWTPVKWFNWVVNATVGNEQFVDERARFAAAVAAGDDPTDPATAGFGSAAAGRFWDPVDRSQPRFLVDTTLSFTPWEKWTFQVNADWATEGRVPSALGAANRQWWGVAGYVKYQFLKNWYVANRTEYFNDEEGSRTGRAQALWETTFTADWALSQPLHIRFEYRHDESNVNSFSNRRGVNNAFAGRHPFRTDSQDTFMMQWLYKF